MQAPRRRPDEVRGATIQLSGWGRAYAEDYELESVRSTVRS